MNEEPIDSTSETEVLATITPSAPRRYIGIGVLSALGALLLYIGLQKPPDSFFWQVFLFVLGSVTFGLAEAMRRATACGIELTQRELRESTGRRLAWVADIERVERGAFAVKPSNGFLLVLSRADSDGNRWAPGLWWRLGRRVGVGGITSAPQAKAVAEMLTALRIHGQTPEV